MAASDTFLSTIRMVSEYHPLATYVGNGVSGGSYMGVPWRIVLHTTETSGMPSYSNGMSAPHITYDPKSGVSIQHTELTTAARALANPSGGVQTNRNNAIQIEIIAYSDKSIADEKDYRLWVGDLTEQHYRELGELVSWVCGEFGVSPSARLPRPTPKYGTSSPARMSGSDWDAFNAICGHFEVPENSHWDPGAFDILRLIDIIKEEDLTPEQTNAVNWLVGVLASKPTDAPPWGADSWAEYQKIWSPPGPAPVAPVTHIQLAKTFMALKQLIAAVSDPDADIEATIAEIVDRLQEN